MGPKKLSNALRSKALGSLCGSSKNKTSATFTTNDDVKSILVCRPHHRLRDLLLLSPLVQELESTFPNSAIDLLVHPSCATQMYQNYDNVEQVIEFPQHPFKNPIKYIRALVGLRRRKYDLAINAVSASISGRIFTSIANAKCKFVGSGDMEKKEQHVAKQVICSLREFLPQMSVKANDAVPAGLDLRLSNEELIEGGGSVLDLVQNAGPTICLCTYATGANCYSERWWLGLYETLQQAFPEANIIEIVSKENATRIASRVPIFHSDNIRELAAMIAGTDVFIGADSGLMHLASSSLTPVIGLFTVTDIERFRPYNEGSVAVKTNEVTLHELTALVKNALYPDLIAGG